ncbi:50S ribosomal protein L28 [Spirochaetota bacterium]|nr:50S ribosomal protein L28 [Spirochaetota bacterium]
MARLCKITGKKTRSANNVSHANNKTKRKQYPNIIKKSMYIPALKKRAVIKISTKALKTINKIGLAPTLKKAGLKIDDILVKD